MLPEFARYPLADAVATAHQVPGDFVEKLKATVPLLEVVPEPVATTLPAHVAA